MERLYPLFRAMDPGEIYQDLSFPPSPEMRPYTVINMVTSVDGKATVGARAYTLGSKTDHLVMRRIRLAADGVMVGAETLRQENVNPAVPVEMEAARVARGMAAQPTAFVVTASADLPLERTFFRSDSFPRVVVTCRDAPSGRVEQLEQRSRVLRVGESSVDLREMMRLLADDLGIERLVVEGGPSMNRALIAQGLVDELFWTVAPKLIAGPAPSTMVEGAPLDRIARLELVSLHHHEGELFARYRVK